MKINYNVTGEKRKSLVGAVSQELNTPAKYLGAPTFAYEIGCYSINKSGVLEGEDNPALVADLLGLHDFMAVGEEYERPKPIEMDEASCLTIEMPRADFTDIAIENLKRLVESKASLIKKVLATEAIDLVISVDTISFPWFGDGTDADAVKAYTHFVTALCDMAKSQQRVNAIEMAVDNEKYAFRCFLLRLGFIGTEYKTERKILLSNLSGSSAFKSGEKKECEPSLESEVPNE
jgi:hypothetical protein